MRAAGAVPATIGVLDGELRVGLTERAERFDAAARKVGPRDLAACVVQGAIGATTVGGTLAACRAAGIRFMGTGGLGGVHRGFPHPPDVSADLGVPPARRRWSSRLGVKSLLDVPATLELLESLGVPVLGFRTERCRSSTTATAARRVSGRVDSPTRRRESPARIGISAAAGCSRVRPTEVSTTSSR